MPVPVFSKAELLEALSGVPDDTPVAVHGGWSDHWSPEVVVRQSRGGDLLVTLQVNPARDGCHYDTDYWPEKKQ